MGPRATLSTSLILHELATNAMKYGALSNNAGRVELAWDIREGTTFQMIWSEIDGPSIKPPTSKGFGSRLIRMGLAGTGGVEVTYHPSGLRAVMSATLGDLQSR